MLSYTFVCLRIASYTFVYLRIPSYTFVYLRIPSYTSVYLRLPPQQIHIVATNRLQNRFMERHYSIVALYTAMMIYCNPRISVTAIIHEIVNTAHNLFQ